MERINMLQKNVAPMNLFSKTGGSDKKANLSFDFIAQVMINGIS